MTFGEDYPAQITLGSAYMHVCRYMMIIGIELGVDKKRDRFHQGCGVGVGVFWSHDNKPGVGVGVGVDQTASTPTAEHFA